MSEDMTKKEKREQKLRKVMRLMSFGFLVYCFVMAIVFKEKFLGVVEGGEEWLILVLIALICACRAIAALLLLGLFFTPYPFLKEIKIVTVGVILAMIGFAFVSLFFNQSYPEAVLHVVGLVGLVWLVNERLHGTLKKPFSQMMKMKKIKEKKA